MHAKVIKMLKWSAFGGEGTLVAGSEGGYGGVNGVVPGGSPGCESSLGLELFTGRTTNGVMVKTALIVNTMQTVFGWMVVFEVCQV